MKKVLIVVDCQNDFISMALRNENAIKAIPNIVKKIRNFDGDLIIATLDTHDENYLETREGKNLPIPHCIRSTDGCCIEANVMSALKDAELKNIPVVYIEKHTFGTDEIPLNIHHFLSINEDLDIEFIGFCTDICVVSNALITKAAFYNRANITVDASCCAGVTPETHKAALMTMKQCQINIVNE